MSWTRKAERVCVPRTFNLDPLVPHSTLTWRWNTDGSYWYSACTHAHDVQSRKNRDQKDTHFLLSWSLSNAWHPRRIIISISWPPFCRLQELLGVAIAPATRQALSKQYKSESLPPKILSTMPVVFVGPYEHHSNEVTWYVLLGCGCTIFGM